MVRLYVRHPVSDYSTWRSAYDSTVAFRTDMKVIGQAVYQAVDDPNDVTVWHDFETREAAEEFVSSDKLKNIMKEAGIAGPPTIWIVNESG
ncbi:MAG: cyclase [Alphaproteobacteria bacterium]|nr:cyclase [Alphaproteobacteria bacterium]